MPASTPPSSTRTPRFQRKHNPPGYSLDERKIALLRALAHHRFLTSDQLADIGGGSHQKTLRLLRVMYDHELIDRPPAQRYQLAKHENKPLVYGLAHAGARILAGLDGTPVREYNWTTKNKRRTTETILHAIDVADVMRAFAKSIRDRGLGLTDHQELLPQFPKATRASAKGASPFSLRVELEQQGSAPHPLAVVPDRLFSIILPSGSVNLALELDEGTMPVRRWSDRKKQVLSLEGTSIARKLLTYFTAWQEDLHVSRWGFQQFRVLFVTSSPKRVQEMLDALDFITNGKGTRFFVFTELSTLLAGDPLGRIWIDGKRQPTALL